MADFLVLRGSLGSIIKAAELSPALASSRGWEGPERDRGDQKSDGLPSWS